MGLISGWLELRRLRKQVRRVPSYALAALPENTLGCVRGIARPLDQRALEAPLSRRTCVYYSLTIIAELHGQPQRLTLANEHELLPFVLEDGDTRAIVDPHFAKVWTRYDHETTSKAAFDADPVQRELLVRHGLLAQDWWNTIRIRYREAVVELDERVLVIAGGIREPDPDARPCGGYRDHGPTRLRLAGTERAPLWISDEPDLLG